ncbi:PQQ-dependent sugar dehydrogenase [Rhodohalobacter barkolensis]|uniref:Glucose/Sorbosone dehydrogenase domain-containing protein n=1 Tax=Rhodohalobacter barkolensis TaxID=2053187 RepID=A0A2N0VGG4_9BACT|nr:PQQ-dependent sugar dehydrogenase [Rhodohalobacter barkolensis]PKD43281.1 hypothetical protein CWD77_11745 [Rhodohalobacter barkolensis]
MGIIVWAAEPNTRKRECHVYLQEQRDDMFNKLKIVFFIGLMALIFIVGMGVAHFQLFPYQYLLGLRTSPVLEPLKNLVRYTAGSPDAIPAYIKNTALQRLLIKEVPLEKYPVSSSTYIVEAAGILHVVSTHGKFISFDLNSYERVESELPPVPMNLDKLIDSPLVGGISFAENHFRVLGVYTETDNKGKDQLYVTHHQYDDKGDCVSLAVSRLELNGEPETGDWETLFTPEPCMRTRVGQDGETQRFHIRQTTGGAMTSYGEDNILFSVGDYGFDGMIHESLSNLPESMFGKIYRLNKRTGEATVFAEGFRNPQGLYTDKEGTVWATDHGPYGGDELNIIREEDNYGWPEVTYGIEYGNKAWPHNPEQGKHEGFQKPEFVWMNAIAPTDILRLESTDSFKEWLGDLLIVSLLNRSLHRVRIGEDNRAIYSESIEIGHRIRNMQLLSNGAVALMTDGKVLIIIQDGGAVYEPESVQVKDRLEDLNRYDSFME